MKCQVCRGPAVVDIRRHNANFCAEHFQRLCHDQVARAISEFAMLAEGERVLVAVSGGKDSLALWQLLLDLGYRADGLYLGLGIAGYSEQSRGYVEAFARDRCVALQIIDLPQAYGIDVASAARANRRPPCSACGLSKRHLFDRAALEGGYDVVATGHNLDDEAAVLFGNVLRWETSYLARQSPALPGGSGFPRKVKPLVRLSERETAAFCILSGIDYQVEECPMADGNRHLGYKAALNAVEAASPGAKHHFYFQFLERAASRFAADYPAPKDPEPPEGAADAALGRCQHCGAPTTAAVCGFCRLVERTANAPSALTIRPPKRAPRP